MNGNPPEDGPSWHSSPRLGHCPWRPPTSSGETRGRAGIGVRLGQLGVRPQRKPATHAQPQWGTGVSLSIARFGRDAFSFLGTCTAKGQVGALAQHTVTDPMTDPGSARTEQDARATSRMKAPARGVTNCYHLVEKAVLWSSFSAEGPRWLLRAGTGVVRVCGPDTHCIRYYRFYT